MKREGVIVEMNKIQNSYKGLMKKKVNIQIGIWLSYSSKLIKMVIKAINGPFQLTLYFNKIKIIEVFWIYSFLHTL